MAPLGGRFLQTDGGEVPQHDAIIVHIPSEADWRGEVERLQVEVERAMSVTFLNIQLLVRLKWKV